LAQSLKSDSISGLIRFAIATGNAYFEAMPKFEFCLPTLGKAVQADDYGPDVVEILQSVESWG
jgi:hypothetical protein